MSRQTAIAGPALVRASILAWMPEFLISPSRRQPAHDTSWRNPFAGTCLIIYDRLRERGAVHAVEGLMKEPSNRGLEHTGAYVGLSVKSVRSRPRPARLP